MTLPWMLGTIRSGDSAGVREIIKLGGSLLGLPGWPAMADALVRARGEGRPVAIVVGGGPIVDGLRAIDAVAPRPPDVAHLLAIELMGATARLVADALGLPIVADVGVDSPAVVDVPRWLGFPGRLTRLPVGWHVTSDSIAALVATETEGDLLLAKRVAPPLRRGADGLAMLADSGWVDPCFPRAAAGIARIAWAAPVSVPVPAVGGTAGEGDSPGGG
ncbi:MAG: hypothetical protein EBR28_10695 [Planctomycetia bacterium]|nr:hypothetical protein [Planctomycetia bacterium]